MPKRNTADISEQYISNLKIIEEATAQNTALIDDPSLGNTVTFLNMLSDAIKTTNVTRKIAIMAVDSLLPEPTLEKNNSKRVKEKTFRHPLNGQTVLASSKRNKTIQQWMQEFPDTDPSTWIVEEAEAVS